MLQCWSAKPADRPTFVQLALMLAGVAGDGSAESVAVVEPSHRDAIAVNDTYMTDEPAEQAAAGSVAETPVDLDQHLALDTVADAGEDADDEYLSVAAGLQADATSGAEEDEDDFEC